MGAVMPRATKKRAEERRAEILDCAIGLFLEKGYEATTIAGILARTRLSKGAFYHHFTSKEELLDAFTERVADAMVAAAKDVLEDKGITEVVRLNRFIERSNRAQLDLKPSPTGALSAALRGENALLFQRIQVVAARVIGPFLTEILQRGMDRGEFDVPDAQIVVDTMLQLSYARHAIVAEAVELARSGDLRRASEMLDQRLAGEQKLLDRILGLPPGSLQIHKPGYARTFLSALAKI